MLRSTASLNVVLRAITFPLLLGLLLVAIKSQDNLSDIEQVGYKLWEIERLQPETIFIGSSHTYRHIDVAYFDSLRGGGKSYNLGLRGATALEIHYQAEQMLKLPFVRNLMIELRTVETFMQLKNRDNRRIYYYHDLRRARLATVAALSFDMPLRKRLEVIRRRYGVVLDHYFLAGQGAALIEASVYEPEPYALQDQRGYLSLDRAAGVERRNQAFWTAEGQAAFFERVEQLRYRDAIPTRTDSTVAAMWVDLFHRAEAQGVGVYFIEHVGAAGWPGLARVLGSALPAGHFLLINDPDRYPEFYDPQNWFDRSHLNERGARQVTALLAELLPPPDALSSPTATP